MVVELSSRGSRQARRRGVPGRAGAAGDNRPGGPEPRLLVLVLVQQLGDLGGAEFSPLQQTPHVAHVALGDASLRADKPRYRRERASLAGLVPLQMAGVEPDDVTGSGGRSSVVLAQASTREVPVRRRPVVLSHHAVPRQPDASGLARPSAFSTPAQMFGTPQERV